MRPFCPKKFVLATISALALAFASGCDPGRDITMQDSHRSQSNWPPQRSSNTSDSAFLSLRQQMVLEQLQGRDIRDPLVLQAMRRVPRHRFVPPSEQRRAYADQALPLSHDQTISQPYIVALMTQLAQPTPQSRALDVGTGSGYQAAVLGEICTSVHSIEIVEPLAERASRLLDELGYQNITVRHGDGFRGWSEYAPFDVIIVAAAPRDIPPALIDQLAPGGRLVIPVGDRAQQLTVVEKQADGSVHRRRVIPVAFVPMTGEAQNGGSN